MIEKSSRGSNEEGMNFSFEDGRCWKREREGKKEGRFMKITIIIRGGRNEG